MKADKERPPQSRWYYEDKRPPLPPLPNLFRKQWSRSLATSSAPPIYYRGKRCRTGQNRRRENRNLFRLLLEEVRATAGNRPSDPTRHPDSIFNRAHPECIHVKPNHPPTERNLKCARTKVSSTSLHNYSTERASWKHPATKKPRTFAT